jgi:hypothetical protein
MATLKYPRVVVEISAVVQLGARAEQVNTKLEPDSVQIQRRSHSHAATCDVTIQGAALPFDPDLVQAASVIVFAGDAGQMLGGNWDGTTTERSRNMRFIGYADEFRREDGERGPYINIKARDVSMLFRHPEVLDPGAIPRYSDTLEEALQRIIDSVLGGLFGHDGKDLSGTVQLRDTPGLYEAGTSRTVNALTFALNPIANSFGIDAATPIQLSKLVDGDH